MSMPKRLAGVGQLDHARDPVIADVAAHKIGGLGEGKVDVRLERAHVLGHQQRGPDQLAQLAVRKLGDAAVAVGVFVPEKALVVAGPPDLDRVAKGDVLAGRVEHQVHAWSPHAACPTACTLAISCDDRRAPQPWILNAG